MSGDKGDGLDRLADLVTQRLESIVREAITEQLDAAGLSQKDEEITAVVASRRYGRRPEWWRAHWAEYGRRVGAGPKPRILLSVARIEERTPPNQRRAA